MADISIVDILLAIVGGIFPTFLWLWFWYNQVERPQSRGFLSLLYIVGRIGVFIVIPIDSFITEEIWSTIPMQTNDKKLLIIESWPTSQ